MANLSYHFDYPLYSDDEEEDRFLLLECSYCHGMMRQPKVMPTCGHEVCEWCFGAILLHCPDKSVMPCPDCGRRNRIGRKGLKTDYQLQRLIETVEQAVPSLTTRRHFGSFLDKKHNYGCQHFPYVPSPITCRHCNEKMCDRCFFCHIEAVRLEIGWFGHRLDERFHKHHFGPTDSVEEILKATKLEENEDEAGDWTRKIGDLFDAESVLTLSPDDVIDLYFEVINCDQQLPIPEKVAPTSSSCERSRPSVDSCNDGCSSSEEETADRTETYVPTEKRRFYDAIDRGDFETVKNIFENKHLPEPCKKLIVGQYRRSKHLLGTPLHYVACLGHYEIFRYLVEEQGANIAAVCPYQDRSDARKMAIHLAAICGHVDIVKFISERSPDMVEATDNFGETPLMAACWDRNEAVIDYLLGKGANIDHRDHWGETPFGFAVDGVSFDEDSEDAESELALYLVRKGCRGFLRDENSAKGAAEWAIKNAIPEIAICILKDMPQEIVDGMKCENGHLPVLHFASKKGRLGVVKLLVNEKHAQVDGKCSQLGRTALHYSIDHLEVVKFLVEEAKGNVMIRSSPSDNESTAAHLAARNGKREVVAYLLERCPELADCKDALGQTPLQVAVKEEVAKAA